MDPEEPPVFELGRLTRRLFQLASTRNTSNTASPTPPSTTATSWKGERRPAQARTAKATPVQQPPTLRSPFHATPGSSAAPPTPQGSKFKALAGGTPVTTPATKKASCLLQEPRHGRRPGRQPLLTLTRYSIHRRPNAGS